MQSSSTVWGEIEARRAAANNHGGVRAVKRQKSSGKLLARERIEQFLEKKYFREIGSAAGFPKYEIKTGSAGESIAGVGQQHTNNLKTFQASNTIGGFGTLIYKEHENQRRQEIVLLVDDFTTRGGHAEGGHWQKQVYLAQQALRYRLPFVQLLDGASGGGSVAMLLQPPYASYLPPLPAFEPLLRLRRIAPIISILLGSVVGLGAARSQLAHVVILCRPIAQLFVAGPPLVAEAMHQKLSKEALGGVETIAHSGTLDLIGESEAECYDMCRTVLMFLSSSAHSSKNYSATSTTQHRTEKITLPDNRREVYDVRVDVIDKIVDLRETPGQFKHQRKSSFFEVGECWGTEAVVGFATIGGKSVGILASDCAIRAGALSAAACLKITRHVRLCEQFSIPLVSLVDQPGFQIGPQAERDGTLRAAADMIDALYQFNFAAKAPYVAVVTRRCFGVGGAAFVSCGGETTHRVAWPSGFWGSLPSRGGVQAAFREQLEKLPDVEARLQAVAAISNRLEVLSSPVRSAETFLVEEIIQPEETAGVIVHALNCWSSAAFSNRASAPVGGSKL